MLKFLWNRLQCEVATPFLGNRKQSGIRISYKPLAYLGKYKYRPHCMHMYVFGTDPFRCDPYRSDAMHCDANRQRLQLRLHLVCNLFVFILASGAGADADVHVDATRRVVGVGTVGRRAMPIVLQYETKTKINKIQRAQNEMFVFAFCLCGKNALPVPSVFSFFFSVFILFFASPRFSLVLSSFLGRVQQTLIAH